MGSIKLTKSGSFGRLRSRSRVFKSRSESYTTSWSYTMPISIS